MSDVVIKGQDTNGEIVLASSSAADDAEIIVVNVSASVAAIDAAVLASNTSAIAAGVSEANASTSEANALASESASSLSASNASTSETNASNSEANALASANNAATSASNASASETNALSSANSAATSASNASTSEANALASANASAVSAGESATSATNALNSETTTASLLASFQGQYVSSPTEPISPDVGDLWFDETNNIMKVYGTDLAWKDAPVDAYTKAESDVLHRSVPVKIKATEIIVKGDVIKATGYNSGEDAIEGVKTVLQTDIAIGVARTDIGIGSFGDIISRGLIEGVDTSLFAFGDILYSNGSGGYTTTRPSGDYQAIGFVVKNHANNGAIMVDFTEPVKQFKTSDTGSAILPSGTTAQRDGVPVDGYLRYNSELNVFEGYRNGAWETVGSGQMYGLASVKAISYNAQSIAENITILGTTNASSVGDITVEDGFSVTLESGSVWKIL